MKIAITSTGTTLESSVGQHFGHCPFFVIYDTTSKGIEFLPNPNRDLEEGAGLFSVRMLNARDVKKIVSGEFGIKVKAQLDRNKIQLILLKDPGQKIREIITLLSQTYKSE